MLKVGITGGIGSGKTTVCRIFATLGVPVYHADDRAKELMVQDAEVIHFIRELLGNEAYLQDGQLNRKYIADKVFPDKDLLQQLNAIVHPAVFRDSVTWFQCHEEQPYVLYEAAIMFESGSNQLMDKMIVVTAPAEERIKRTMKRDTSSREEVMARMNKQLPDEEKIKKADYVIYNDLSQPLIEQVLTIHRDLIVLSK